MKAVTDWLLAQSQRLVIVAIVAAPLLPIVTAALLALETIKRGALRGLTSAAFGVAGLSLLAAASRTAVETFALIGVGSMGTGVVVGLVIRWAGNLVLAFQTVWLVCFLVVLGFAVVGPDPATVFAPVLAQFKEMLQAPTGSETEVAELVARLAQILPAVTVFSGLAGALLLGYWWWTVASGPPRFAAEFRRLKLGRWLGSTATAVVVLGLAFGAPLVQNLLPLALFGFVFQGLAVVHAWVYARRWHPAVLVLLYAMLVLPPLTIAVMVPLVIVGLVDNGLDLRKPVRSAA